MTENSTKDFTHHPPPVEDYNNTDYLVTRIGVGTGITDEHPNRYDRFEIAFKRFKLGDYETFEDALAALEESRGIKPDLQNVLDMLVKSIFTAPQYHTVLCYQEGEKGPDGSVVTIDSEFYKVLKPKGHEAAQVLADGYIVGARVVGVSQKAVVQAVKKAEAELGMTHGEMVAKMKEMQEAGLLD